MRRNVPSDVWKFIAKRGADECWPWVGFCIGDMAAKGRSPDNRGERNPNAKLSDNDVTDIRWIASKGIAPSEVAKRYRISWTQAKRIMAGTVRHA